jgi:hypothetical protein
MYDETPSIGKLAGALLLASAAAASPTILLGPLVVIAFPIGFVIAMLHALVLGFPAYLLLRRHRLLGAIPVALAGFGIGAVPVGLLSLDGAPIVSGEGLWIIGLFGMLGALVFRLRVGRGGEPVRFDPAIWE